MKALSAVACALVAGFVLVAPFTAPCAAAGAAASAAGPWEGAAFAADPAALAKAAGGVTGEEDDSVVVLLADADYSFDAAGRETYVNRVVYKILSGSFDESWAAVEESWEPWHQARPEIRARVVTADGASHPLDESILSESAAAGLTPDMFEDGKVLRGPLPAVKPGAVVEVVVTIRDTAPFFDAGTVRFHSLDLGAPIRHARVTVRAPLATPLRWAARRLPGVKPEVRESGGERRVTFEARDLEPAPDPESGLPPDVPRFAYVAFSTAGSWSDLARRYSAIVDQAIAGSNLEAELREIGAAGGAASQTETIDRALRRLSAEVRYTGIELGEGSLVPRTPAETLRRKFGDCKDKAVLLAAVLRALDIPAYVALLDAGEDDADIEPELPGMGSFNHAIVVVPGSPALWIDPTDPYARAGELPLADQGRLALIASASTTALVRTPESTANDNHDVETREITLSELGKGRAVETGDYWGSTERTLRAAYATGDAKTVRERMTSYANVAYGNGKLTAVTHSDPADLSKPFHLRLEIADAGLAVTDVRDAAVALQPGLLLRHLPADLLAADDSDSVKDGSEKEAPEARQEDYLLPCPATYELRYRITPPPGFAPRLERKNQTRRLGPALLSEEYSVAADRTVVATLRLSTGKRRYTPQEVEALRAAVKTVLQDKPIVLAFDQVGEGHLAAGRVREALDEFRRLAAASPKSALPHLRIARALLAGGLGQAAREEAARAVKLEPKSALVQRDLGWILQHDEIGRRFGAGFDRAGAIAAYRKAIEIDPKDNMARADLAILLEHDGRGRRYAVGADLPAAIQEYQTLRKDGFEAMSDNLLVALFRAERFGEAKELADKLARSQLAPVLAVASVAATQGIDAALREGERRISDEGSRSATLTGAAQNLIAVRRYDEAAGLLDHAGRQSENAAGVLARAELLRRAQRHEKLTFPAGDPVSVVKRLVIAFTAGSGDVKTLAPLVTAEVGREFIQTGETSEQQLGAATATLQRNMDDNGISSESAIDFAMTMLQFSASGDDATGFRVASRSAVGDKDDVFRYFVVKEGGEYRVAAVSGIPHMLGREALSRLDRGDLAGARQWLDWASEDLEGGKGDDPVPANPIAGLWSKGKTEDVAAARCAAASLLATDRSTAARAPALLDACRTAAPEAERIPLDLARVAAFGELEKPEQALAAAEQLVAEAPSSRRAFLLRAGMLAGLKRWDALRQICAERLKALPGDPDAVRTLARADMAEDKLAEADERLAGLVAAGKAEAGDYNELAWMSLFTGKVDDKSLEYGQRATTLTNYQGYAYLHTLASLYADRGKPAEAYRIILQALEAEPGRAPSPSDWYVFGRLAESYQMPDAARGFYQRAVKVPERPLSTRALAEKRLAALGPGEPAGQPARAARQKTAVH
jgi:tetratricopeptide (TPR) repeat protein/transglutaminase-like putative cysteine protease